MIPPRLRLFVLFGPLLLLGARAQEPQPPPKPGAPDGAEFKRIPPCAPRPGYVCGRAFFADGRPVPRFTVTCAGQKGGPDQDKVVPLGEGEGRDGQYRIKVPFARVREVRAVATVAWQGQTYALPLCADDEMLNGPQPGGLRENSGRGVVRDFTLRGSGPVPTHTPDADGAAEVSTEPPAVGRYYGGTIALDLTTATDPNAENAIARSAGPGSSLFLTLTPQGGLLDGSPAAKLERAARLGAVAGRGGALFLNDIPLGAWRVTGTLVTPDSRRTPLRFASDRVAWKKWAVVTFAPAPADASGVQRATLYAAR